VKGLFTGLALLGGSLFLAKQSRKHIKKFVLGNFGDAQWSRYCRERTKRGVGARTRLREQS
jgi:hypothetical protein